MTNFNQAYESILSTIDFDPAWKNATGYLDAAVEADLGLKPGALTKFVDDFGRRAIVIGTRFGNVVVFERYSPKGEERSNIWVHNSPTRVRSLVGTSNIPDYHIGQIVRSESYNLGLHIERLFQ